MGPGPMRPQAEWSLGPQQLSRWELGDFSMGMGSCFHPMAHENEGHWVLGNCTFVCKFCVLTTSDKFVGKEADKAQNLQTSG